MTASPAQPAIDEVEVTVLGPGYGESILIHIGNSKWIIIDSCLHRKTKTPAALEYLQSLGVEVSSSVILIIVSHWHDDHIRGMASLLEACPAAEICLSSVMTNAEFGTQLEIFRPRRSSTAAGSGLDEADRIWDFLVEQRSRRPGWGPLMAMKNRRLVHYSSATFAHGLPCEVWSLSPSDEEFRWFMSAIGALAVPALVPAGRIPALRPNNASVVTWVRIGPHAFLFGGDLEETGRPGCGWSSIAIDPNRPSGKADLFKIPHHGSVNAHCGLVWSNMLHPDPLSVVTPYNRGRTPLPTKSDIYRIVGLSSGSIVTARQRSGARSTRYDPAVDRTLKEIGARLTPINEVMGRATFRNKPVSEGRIWRVTLSREAARLAESDSGNPRGKRRSA